jgi:antitoxin component YwqK of YwqJK toxin-antitoxin module
MACEDRSNDASKELTAEEKALQEALSKKAIDYQKELLSRDGIWVDKDHLKPYSGKVYATLKAETSGASLTVIEEGLLMAGEKHGVWIERYPSSGTKKRAVTYKSRKRHGKWTEWFLEEKYIPSGLDVYSYAYSRQAEIERRSKLSEAQRVAEDVAKQEKAAAKKRYADTDPKSVEGDYKDDKKNGTWVSWHRNGRKASEANYKNDVRDGTQSWWHENGKRKREEHYLDGKNHGVSVDWYENGKKQREEHYQDGKNHGVSVDWYENGKKQREEHYQDGKKHGVSVDWYENGKKQREEHYQDGKKHGVSLVWYENGKQEQEGQYKDGKAHGAWSWWKRCWLNCTPGELWKDEGQYYEGKKYGRWTQRDGGKNVLTGYFEKKLRVTCYQNGQLVSCSN